MHGFHQLFPESRHRARNDAIGVAAQRCFDQIVEVIDTVLRQFSAKNRQAILAEFWTPWVSANGTAKEITVKTLEGGAEFISPKGIGDRQRVE